MSEIEKQSDFFMACNQVVYKLPFMFGTQICNSFQFNNHFVFNYHIWDIMPNNFILIIYIYLHYACYFFVVKHKNPC